MAKIFRDFNKAHDALVWLIGGVLEYEDKDLKKVMDALSAIEEKYKNLGFNDSHFKASNDYFRYEVQFFKTSDNNSYEFSINGSDNKITISYYDNGLQMDTICNFKED